MNVTFFPRGVFSMDEVMKLATEETMKMVEEICWSIDMDDPCSICFTSVSIEHIILFNIVYKIICLVLSDKMLKLWTSGGRIFYIGKGLAGCRVWFRLI